MILAPATLALWAALALLLLSSPPLPLGALVTLVLLQGGFEAVNALHVGVERIGRYVQVFYEETSANTSAAWETTAMAQSPGLPGGGIDPLFSALFCAAVLLNAGVALIPWPTAAEAGVVGVFHVLALVRMVRARRAAARQRARDLEHYRKIRDSRL
jgi:hypothetical protein